jgi:hypothetical protein
MFLLQMRISKFM